MPGLHRRQVLAGAGAAVVAPRAAARRSRRRRQASPFPWGVASFDPTGTSVLLWTRVEPPADGSTVALDWLVAADERLTDVVARGSVEASAETGWCTSVEAGGLAPGTTWWFAFATPDGGRSPVGRTRTLPPDGATRVRLGVVACSRYAAGGFAGYRALAEREVDLVVHLGDYVYEDGEEGARPHEPAHELRSLDDYRARYAQHRTDPDLQALHARHPMVAIWDDHDVAGNAWRDGARSHDDATDGPWAERLAAALGARGEWLPGRTAPADRGVVPAWRSFALGDLAELVLLDARLWGRDRPPASAADVDGERSMLGADQMAFVRERLERPDRAPWVLLANQVMLHPLRIPVPSEALAQRIEERGFLVVDGEALNPDQWDGYPAAREELLRAVGGRGGVVALTGDVHSSWAWEGPANDGGAPTMVELIAPSITSETFGSMLPVPATAAEAGLRTLDDLSFIEIQSHGYLVVDVTPERVVGEWWYVDPDDPGSQRFGAARAAPVRVPMHLEEVTEPTEDPSPPTTGSGTTTTAPVPEEPTADGGSGPPLVALGGAGAAVVAGVVAGVVALRRRRA